MNTQHFQFQVPIQIRMSDLDPFNHVNNGSQCNYFDYGRACYFEYVFAEPINWLTLDMVLANVTLDFKSPITFGESIICETKVVKIGNRSFIMEQQIVNIKSHIIKTKCQCVIVGFDRETQKSAPLNSIYKEKISIFEQLANTTEL